MSHAANIGAGVFSDLSVAIPSTILTTAALKALVEATYKDLFTDEIESVGGTPAANTFVRLKNVREFPALGTPPNIVNVPTYGSKVSNQVQGQADVPSLEVTINYVAADWADGSVLGDAVGDQNQYAFRFALLNKEPVGYATDSLGGAASMGTVPNSLFFWYGKLESMQVSPNLTDSNTCTVTLSLQSDFHGMYTVDGA